jgi:hypothetical protein
MRLLMIPETLREVLQHEGVVAIATQGPEGAHLVNTWNSYLAITGGDRFLGPVGGMNKTEANVRHDNRVLVTMGSRDVQGLRYMGTGFLVEGIAVFLYEGKEFSEVKERFPWARAAIEIRPESITQTL